MVLPLTVVDVGGAVDVGHVGRDGCFVSAPSSAPKRSGSLSSTGTSG